MAVTVTISKRSQWGDRVAVQAVLTFSGTYPTGGETITPSNFNLATIERLLFEGVIVDASSTALLPYWKPATGSVMCFEAAASGAPFIEKNSSEAYVAGAQCRVLVLGA